jgi:2-phosphosulfolactate phosphatase
VIFLTSNGTKAARLAHQSDEILLACLRNAPAVVTYLEGCSAERVNIVCSGSGGMLNMEDFTCAAYIMANLYREGMILNDAAQVAMEFGRLHRGEERKMLEKGKVGQYLIAHDETYLIDFAADIGSSSNVPFLTREKMYLQVK